VYEGGGGRDEVTTHRLKHFNPYRGKERIYFLSSSCRFGLQTALRKISGKTFQRIKILARKRVALVFPALLIDCTAMLYKENYGSSVLLILERAVLLNYSQKQ